jgi:hypothetical protein
MIGGAPMEILALAYVMAIGLTLIMALLAWNDDQTGHGRGVH